MKATIVVMFSFLLLTINCCCGKDQLATERERVVAAVLKTYTREFKRPTDIVLRLSIDEVQRLRRLLPEHRLYSNDDQAVRGKREARSWLWLTLEMETLRRNSASVLCGPDPYRGYVYQERFTLVRSKSGWRVVKREVSAISSLRSSDSYQIRVVLNSRFESGI